MKDIPTSPRIAQIKRNRRVRRLRLIILFGVLFIVFVGALSYFSSHHKILINKIMVSGNSIVDTEEIKSNINSELNGKYFYLFSRANFLIYPHDKIYDSLIYKFPRIESLSIKREGLNTIKVTIEERAGSYLYCGLDIPLIKEEIGENCYFVNNDGLIFDKAPYFSGDVYFKYYMKILDDKSNPLGAQMILPERFHELVRFTDGVSSLGLKPAYLVISNDGTHSLYLKSSGGNQNPKIIFKEDNSLPLVFDNLATAMNEKEFANEINSKYDTLSYIDLRFKNKVLYKFQ